MEWFEWKPEMDAYVHPTAKFDSGTDILGYVGAGAEIGRNCYIQGIVMPGAKIGEYCWIAPNGSVGYYAVLLGHNSVCGRVEEGAILGYDASVADGITIGRRSMVEAGCFVDADVPPFSVVMSLEAFKMLHYRAPVLCFTHGRCVWISYYHKVMTPEEWLAIPDDYYPDRPNEARDLKALLRAVLAMS